MLISVALGLRVQYPPSHTNVSSGLPAPGDFITALVCGCGCACVCVCILFCLIIWLSSLCSLSLGGGKYMPTHVFH